MFSFSTYCLMSWSASMLAVNFLQPSLGILFRFPWHSIYNLPHWKVITGLVFLITSVWLWFSGWFLLGREWRVSRGGAAHVLQSSWPVVERLLRLHGICLIESHQWFPLSNTLAFKHPLQQQLLESWGQTDWNFLKSSECNTWVQCIQHMQSKFDARFLLLITKNVNLRKCKLWQRGKEFQDIKLTHIHKIEII